MGTLRCSRCNAQTEANSIEEGRKRLDHSAGLIIGMPCEDGRANLYLTGIVDTPKPKSETSETFGKSKKQKKIQSKD